MTFGVKTACAVVGTVLLWGAYKVLFLNDLLFWPSGWFEKGAYVTAFVAGMLGLIALLAGTLGAQFGRR